MEELVSVLIPAYNVEKYIGQCIDSVLAQTYQNIEIVIVDDGSTDNTLSLCKAYEKENSKIRVVHKQNGGVSSARNQALELAKGDLIAWVDADDCVNPRYIETLYNMMKESGVEIAVIGFEKFCDSIPTVQDSRYAYSVCDKKYSLTQLTYDYFWLVQWGKLIRKDLYSGIRYPEGKNHEDEFIMYKLYYQVNRVAYSQNKLYFYRDNPESIMGKQYNESRLLVLEAIRQRLEFYEQHEEEELARLTILKLLGMYRNHYYLVKENLKSQSLMDDLYGKYMELFEKNKKRCKIKVYKQPELYIIPHQQFKPILRFMAKAKHKLGFIYW